MKRILPIVLLLGTAACAAGRQQAADLPAPCAPEAAARALADTTSITPPISDRLAIPPDRPPGSAAGTFRLTITIGVDGRVVPGTARVVAGPNDPAYTAKLLGWAERLRFRPATVDGCAIARETTLSVTI